MGAEAAMQRRVEKLITAHRQSEGGGFIVRRPFPTASLDMVDPFLLLDEMGPADYAPGEAVGAPDHPHRGFETVTYMLAGEFEHADSAGHRGKLKAGDVQWMTAGSGIVHSELPSKQIMEQGGRVHGFQLWVNLPGREKMMAPRYQEVPAQRIPKARSADGLAEATVIAGEALGVKAVIDTRTPILYHHWRLKPGADAIVELPDYRVFAFVFEGAVELGESNRRAEDGQMAVFSDSGNLRMRNPDSFDAQLLLIGGKPLNEPVARYGPFVMNTREEIIQAVQDFQAGRMG
jgi:quercetin 2,3-dioxygenase